MPNLRRRALDLLRTPCSRERYLLTGVGLMIVKFLVDRQLSLLLFGRSWMPWNYFAPGRSGYFSNPHSDFSGAEDPSWPVVATLLVTAIPFILVGVIYTVRRLHSLRWPAWWVGLFFVPWINLVFFALLSILPNSTDAVFNPGSAGRRLGRVARLFTNASSFQAGAMTVLLCALVGVPLIAFSTLLLEDYGWGLFVGMPFLLGLVSALLDGCGGRRTVKRAMLVAISTVAFVGLLCIAVALEGAICVVMAAPLAVPLAMVGGVVGWSINETRSPPDLTATRLRACGVIALLAPALLVIESFAPGEAQIVQATTRIEIDAPPETAWQYVVSFSELPAADEAWFRAGIAHPLRARIDGTGVGAVRYCEFTTGPFVEPITTWDPPRHLAFDVISQPAPMQEWSPWSTVEPAHLDGFFRSRRGEFRLTSLDGGQRTLLEGSTWYSHQIWPGRYWRHWSDYLIHTIHDRVLRHIKSLAETAASHGALPPLDT